jgi:sec-independent protein translocase protein TatA
MDLGPAELILILVIVLLLFGVGRIGKIGSELGVGIRAFREGLKGEEEKKSAGDHPAHNSFPGSGESSRPE